MTVLGTFRVDGPPVPKKRARTYVGKDGKVHTSTPKITRVYEEQIGWHWRGLRRFKGAVKVTVRVIEGKTGHPADLDNYVKSVLDGLNGVAWVDDRQVVELSASIMRGDPRPALDVIVEGWDEGPKHFVTDPFSAQAGAPHNPADGYQYPRLRQRSARNGG